MSDEASADEAGREQDAAAEPVTPVPQLIDQVKPLLSPLKQEEREQVLRIVQTAVHQYQGPLPPPDMMRGYNAEITDGANRLMLLLEKQTNHRIDMENRVVNGKLRLSKVGQALGFVLALFFGCIALAFGLYGHEILAGTVLTTTIIGLAVVFVLGREPGGKAKAETPESNQAPAPKKPSAPRRKR
ncbi:MAG: DUF2335 domain-containing protein [Hydrogenophaga sp.]|nr:DUF2335 domain-containing protein [Hydrogenophaga sp.]